VRRVLVRLAGVAVVVVAATASAWVLVHVLRPNLFADEEGSFASRLAHYLERAFLHFDFGMSNAGSRRPVATLIREGLPADVSLLAGGLGFGLLLGTRAALICARRPRGRLSHGVQALAMLAMCAPVYVVGLMALLLFGEDIGKLRLGIGIPLDYVPFSDGPLRWAGSLVVPWIVLGLPLAALCLRVMLGEMVEVLGEDYVRAARAKGLTERVVLRRHVAPPAMAPTAMVASASMPWLLTNAVLIEQVFSIPGVFRDLTRSIGAGNYPLIFGMTAVGALLIALSTMLFDIYVEWLDPRIRDGAAAGG
jgi:peptide/nickel transport system permease protein